MQLFDENPQSFEFEGDLGDLSDESFEGRSLGHSLDVDEYHSWEREG